MPARKTSASVGVGRTRLGGNIATVAREVAAHLRGDMVRSDTVDVAALRSRPGLSQAMFARAFGLDLGALRAWEQHRKRPDPTARILLVDYLTRA